MPVLERRQQTLLARHDGSLRDNSDGVETEHLWVVEEDYEHTEEGMELPKAKLNRQPPRQKTRNTLRINTYPKAELHERYLSSEEEPSPSPSENVENHDVREKHESATTSADESIDISKITESKAEIAIAVPIMVIGRPKLIDITNLAPMQKRKRASQPLTPQSISKKVASRVSRTDVENLPSLIRDPAEAHVPGRKAVAPKRKDSLPPMEAPESWLPEEEPEQVGGKELYFPLDVRRTPAYRDYDPYSLEPPRLSRTNSPTSTKDTVRERVNSSPPVTVGSVGWKGLGRSLSLAKRQSTLQQRQVVKKPKMVARGATEREEMPIIPPFPFEGGIVVG